MNFEGFAEGSVREDTEINRRASIFIQLSHSRDL
jgi:hypothetical protein